jgi:diaminohydroxyphosphoribosylaminopyrimidine deaminase/5-amino-6-(5-phosphoribosylamino)uracil reductase
LDTSLSPTLIFTSHFAPEASLQTWKESNVDYKIISTDPTTGYLNLEEVLEELGKRGILQVLLEGGGTLHSQFIKYASASNKPTPFRLVVYQGPCVIGGTGISWLQQEIATTIKQAQFWKLKSVKQFGNDVRMEYFISK